MTFHKYCDTGDYNSEATGYQEYAISSKTKYQDFEKAQIKTNVRHSSSESGPTFTETSKGKTVFKEEEIVFTCLFRLEE